MPKYNATLTNIKPKLDKEGNEVPQTPIVIEALDAPTAKAKAITQLKPEASQDIELVEIVAEAVN